MELAQLAEELGYDHLWVYDHVETVPRREPTHLFEAFTMLAALSQRTSRVALGQLVTCAAYRNVGLLAKEAACVDVYSGGRLILGLGAGWYEREYQAYGFEFPTARERLAHPGRGPAGHPPAVVGGDGELRRRPTCTSTAPTATPSRSSHRPPILVGGGGEQVTLRLAARHADLTNWQVGIEAFERKSKLLEGYCDDIGATVRRHHPHPRSRLPDLRHRRRGPGLVRRSPAAVTCRATTRSTTTCADNLVGTVEQVTEKAQAYVDAGCRPVHPVAARLPGRRDPAPLDHRGRPSAPSLAKSVHLCTAPVHRCTDFGLDREPDTRVR